MYTHPLSLSLSLSLFLSLSLHFPPFSLNNNNNVHAEVQRIYQSRISSINNHVNVDTFEVIGLVSIELEAGSSDARPTYFFDCNTTFNNGSGITWPYNGDAPRFRIEPIPSSTNGKRLSASGITESDLGVYNCLDTYTNINVSINITQGERPCSSLLSSLVATNGIILSTQIERSANLCILLLLLLL